MRIATALTIAAALASGLCLAKAELGGLYGQVVDLGTGQPIEGALVMAPATGDTQRADGHGCFSVSDAIVDTGSAVKVDLLGMIFGGSLLTGESRIAVSTDPRWLIVWAPGYRAFDGLAPIVFADATIGSAVAERICLAPRGGGRRSAQAGRDDAAHVRGIGLAPIVEPERIVVPSQSPTETLRVRGQAPEALPLSYEVGALLSTGRRVQFPTGATAQVRLPAQAGVVEVVSASRLPSIAGVSRKYRGSRGVLGRYGPRSWESDPALELRPGITDETAEGLAQAVKYLVLTPESTVRETEAADWAELCLWRGRLNSGDLAWEDAQQRLAGLPEGPQRLYFQGILALARGLDHGDLASGIEQLDALVGSSGMALPPLLARDRALAYTRLALQSAADHARETALEAIAGAAEALWDYGPGLRQLADGAHELGDTATAAGLYHRAAQRLAPIDREVTHIASFVYRCGQPWGRRSARRLAETLGAELKAARTTAAGDWIDASRALLESGVPDRAEKAAATATTLASDDARAWLQLGRALQAQGKPALEAYRTAARLCPETAEAWYAMGRIYWEQGRRERAVRDFTRAAEAAPGSELYLRAALLGNAWAQAQQDPGAGEAAAVMFYLDRLQSTPGQMQTAAELAAAAPQTEWTRWVLGCTETDSEKAVEHLSAAADLSPTEPFLAAEIAAFELRESGPDEAAEAARQARRIDVGAFATPSGLPPEYQDLLRQLRRRALMTVEAVLAAAQGAG